MGLTLRCAAAVMLPVLGTISPGGLRVPATPMVHKAPAPQSIFRGALFHTAGGSFAGTGASCGAGKDMVVQALELLKADSSRNDLADADEHLKRAIDLCGESGEAWYYRSLVEDKLGHKPQAEFALRKAHMFPSEALSEGINPFVLAAPKGAEPLGPIREKWALIVGIADFQDKAVPKLTYTKQDADLFHDVLVDSKHGAGFKEENVRVLTNDKATLKSVKEGLNWLARKAGANDLVVVYFASHGTAHDQDTEGGASYIAMHDTVLTLDPAANAKRPDDLTVSDEYYATALPMVEMANDVATRFKARRTAIFIDTCHSGSAATAGGGKLIAADLKNASVSKETLQRITQGEGRIIFAASEPEQSSYESKELKHGYFTYSLVQVLRQHPEMPLSQIFTPVQQQVAAGVDQNESIQLSPEHGHQTPVMGRSSDSTDFALGGDAAATTARLAGP